MNRIKPYGGPYYSRDDWREADTPTTQQLLDSEFRRGWGWGFLWGFIVACGLVILSQAIR